jgi:hypothetical protein
MAIDRFQSRFKTRNDLMDQITPNNVVQTNVSVPAGEWKPAAWLPIIWQNQRSKDYFVMSAGKIVSFFADGRIIPAGYLARAAAAQDADHVMLTYEQMDQDARVIDLTTGKFVDLEGAGSKSVTLGQFVQALADHGLISLDHPGLAVDAAIEALQAAVNECISSPVGVLSYDVFVWAGDDPAHLHFTNYQKQHLIQFFTDIQMKVPQVVEGTDSKVIAAADVIPGATLATMARYTGLPVESLVAVQLGQPGNVAANTTRTPIKWTNLAAGASTRLRSGLDLLAKEGDWFVDEFSAMLFVYSNAGAGVALPAVFANKTIQFYVYDGAVSTQERMQHFVGSGKPGDYVTFDENSNFVAIPNGSLLEAITNGMVCGRLLTVFKEPKSLLERVRTGFQGEEFGPTGKMPGSATRGFSDLITLSQETVADQIVVINVKIQ